MGKRREKKEEKKMESVREYRFPARVTIFTMETRTQVHALFRCKGSIDKLQEKKDTCTRPWLRPRAFISRIAEIIVSVFPFHGTRFSFLIVSFLFFSSPRRISESNFSEIHLREDNKCRWDLKTSRRDWITNNNLWPSKRDQVDVKLTI